MQRGVDRTSRVRDALSLGLRHPVEHARFEEREVAVGGAERVLHVMRESANELLVTRRDLFMFGYVRGDGGNPSRLAVDTTDEETPGPHPALIAGRPNHPKLD